jgi:hypothetical protein
MHAAKKLHNATKHTNIHTHKHTCVHTVALDDIVHVDITFTLYVKIHTHISIYRTHVHNVHYYTYLLVRNITAIISLAHYSRANIMYILPVGK